MNSALPLLGKTLVVTRPRQQADELQSRLEQLGACVVGLPTIEIIPAAFPKAVGEEVRKLSTFDWVVFTSPNAVDFAMRALFLEGMDAQSFAGIRIAAVGPATSDALGRHGLYTDLMPKREFTTSGMFQALQEAEIPLSEKRFLLPQGNIAREDLAVALRDAGVEVVPWMVYQTVTTQGKREETEWLIRNLQARQIDGILFCSPSAVIGFVERLKSDFPKRAELLLLTQHALFASIGPVTTEAISEHFKRVDIEAKMHTIPGLVAAIQGYFQSQSEKLVNRR